MLPRTRITVNKQYLCTAEHNMYYNCALLDYYTVSSGNFLLIFWDNLLVPSSKGTLKMGPIGCPKMSVRNYQYLLCNNSKVHSTLLLRIGSL